MQVYHTARLRETVIFRDVPEAPVSEVGRRFHLHGAVGGSVKIEVELAADERVGDGGETGAAERIGTREKFLLVGAAIAIRVGGRLTLG